MKKLTLTILCCATWIQAEEHPFLGLGLNLPRAAEFLSTTAPPEAQEDPQFKLALGALRMLGDTNADLLLYNDATHGPLPIITLPGGQAALTKVIEEGPLNPIFVKDGDGYKVNPELAPPKDDGAKAEGIPMEEYLLRFTEGSAVFAPELVHKRLAAGEIQPFTSKLGGEQGLVKISQNLVTLAINFPDQLGEDLSEKIADNQLGSAVPPAEMVTELGSALIDMLFEPLKKIQGFRVGFRFDGENGRKLSYLQTFRDVAEGQKVFEALQANTLEPGEEVLAGVLETIHSEGFTSRMGYQDGRLLMQTSWDKSKDEVVGENIMGVVMGAMMGAAMAGDATPSDGEVITEYENAPKVFAEQTGIDGFKNALEKSIPTHLFPGHYWDFGNTPKMTIELDGFPFPNLSLYELSYDINSVTAADGSDIRRAEENKFNKLHLRLGFGANISIPVKKEIKAEDLGTAEIVLTGKGPVGVQLVELNELGEKKSSGKFSATLKQMEGDVVVIIYKGAERIDLVAYDQTGKALRMSESFGGGGSKQARFRGTPTKVQVAAQVGEATFTLPLTIDLNKGKRIVLPEEPAEDVPVRYRANGTPQYRDISDEEMAAMKVEWEPARSEDHYDSLFVTLPRSSLHFQHKDEVHFFGEEGEIMPETRPVHGDRTRLVTGVGERGEHPVRALFGKHKFTFSRGLAELHFVKTTDGEAISQKGTDGKNFTVTIDKNHVVLPYDNDHILYRGAIDANGLFLRDEKQKSTQDKRMRITYWGQVQEVVLVVRTGVTEHLVPFDLKVGEVDKAAYAAFKTGIENRRKIFEALSTTVKTLNRNPDNFHYAENLAGWFYVHDKKAGGKARELIPREIAHSDPAATEIFGYEATPYLGHYFTLAKGRMQSDGTPKDRLNNNKDAFIWDGGKLIASRYGEMLLIALPVDPKQPVWVVDNRDEFRYKVLESGKLEYLPDYKDLRENWEKAAFTD